MPSRGILHRDLKPANILVDEQSAPHVTDFGLARRIDPDATGNDSRIFAGTPAYMSPEQTSGRPEELTTAVDVYGLGAIFYALLTGRAPHAGTSLTETLDRVRAVQPETPSRLNPRVPRRAGRDLPESVGKGGETPLRQRAGTGRRPEPLAFRPSDRRAARGTADPPAPSGAVAIRCRPRSRRCS